jgi:hypothetical protein
LFGSWTLLTAATRVILQRHFRTHKIALAQKNGKTGYGMLAAIFVAFVLVRWFAGR